MLRSDIFTWACSPTADKILTTTAGLGSFSLSLGSKEFIIGFTYGLVKRGAFDIKRLRRRALCSLFRPSPLNLSSVSI